MSPMVLEHFRNPRNVGELAPPAITIEVSNPICGDILRLSISVRDGVIEKAQYKVRGCAASIAAGSITTELLTALSVGEMDSVTREKIESALGGLSNESKHAAVLSAEGVRAALRLLQQAPTT